MNPIVSNVTFILAVAVLAIQIVSVVIVLFYVSNKHVALLGKHALLGAFVVSLVATLGSLFYSEIAGFTPCSLCWYQRIFMYPLPILLLIAYIKKDRTRILDYVLWLSVMGAVIAAYHYYGQVININVLPCNTPGTGPACAVRPFMSLGYITIPMMAFAGFVFNIVVTLYAKRFGNNL